MIISTRYRKTLLCTEEDTAECLMFDTPRSAPRHSDLLRDWGGMNDGRGEEVARWRNGIKDVG